MNRAKYKWPQCYPIKERIELIEKELNEGNSFIKVSQMFDVTEAAIKYHWNRYKLSKKPRYKSKKLKKTKLLKSDPYKDYLHELVSAGLL